MNLVSDITDQKPMLYRAVESLEANGSTALYDAVYEGLQKVARGKHKKKAILLITDDNHTASNASFGEVVEMAKKTEVLIYGLGIGHGSSALSGTCWGATKMKLTSMSCGHSRMRPAEEGTWLRASIK